MISAKKQAEMIRDLEQAMLVLKSMPVSRSCSECAMWRFGQCEAAGAVPPPEVQKSGCELFELEDCPF